MCVLQGWEHPTNVLWIDNYSKVLAVGMARISTGMFTECLWTTMGRLTVPIESRDKYDMKIRPEISGFPTRLWRHHNKRVIQEWWDEMDKEGYNKFDVSF